MKLVSILNEELIFTGINGVSRSGIYTEMLKKAQSVLGIPLNVDQIVSGLIEREDTLQIPYEGCALPHLRNAGFDDLYIIIGILPKPIHFKESDVAPCDLVVMSLISPDTSDLYLKSLSAMVRFLAKPGNLKKLSTAKNAAGFLEILREANVTVRNNLVAEDVMVSGAGVLRENDTLSTALDCFSRDDNTTVPVLDNNGHLVGVLTAIDILKGFIPEYIFRMDNLEFLTSFEPFTRIFQEENQHVVKDYMHAPRIKVHPETPLIQFTVKMVKNNVRTCFVVDADGKYIGEIMIRNIVKKVLRG
ncbi:MAG: PTS sugar transporter subunit IIA [Victivallales bacterium]|jgi:mannitol/fructose-specific phosphotransferase system IIA component (Ntr-type)/CBS domain-containing protein|nr:PTS sugar transporter subunit IIA [Victivallales bacterium]